MVGVVERAARFVVQLLQNLSGVPGLHVPLQVPPPHEHLPAKVAPVGRVALRVQPDVLVQVARVSKGPEAHFAFERLVPRVSPHVDLQAVLPGVQLPAVETQVALLGFARAGGAGASGGHRVQPSPTLVRADLRQLLRVHGDLPVDVRDGAQVLAQLGGAKVGHGVRVLEEVAEVEFERVIGGAVQELPVVDGEGHQRDVAVSAVRLHAVEVRK